VTARLRCSRVALALAIALTLAGCGGPAGPAGPAAPVPRDVPPSLPRPRALPDGAIPWRPSPPAKHAPAPAAPSCRSADLRTKLTWQGLREEAAAGTVRLTNTGPAVCSLPAGPPSFELRPGERATFEMVTPIPGTARPGPSLLTWMIGTGGTEAEFRVTAP